MSGLSVAFLCQAGPGVGLGHLRRCLTLAEALRRRGARVAFLANGDEGARPLVEEHGFPAVAAPTVPEGIRGLVRGPLPDPDGLVLDILDLPAPLAALAKRHARSLAIITETDGPLPDADLVLDSRFAAEERSPAGSPGTTYLFGPRYALLRPEFAREPARATAPSVGKILITVGGSDPHGLTARLVELARRLEPAAHVDVVIGPFFAEAGTVEALAASRPGPVRLHRNPQDMRALMLEADVALSAGGQTLFELAATATPAVAIQVAPNQGPNLRALAGRGALRLAAEASDPDLDVKVAGALGGLRDPAARARMGERGRASVDGRGTARVAEAMLAVFGRSPSRSGVGP